MSDTTISIVPISKAAQRTVNPIRSIVDGLRIQPHPDKHMISLALGDPTLFGNFQTAPLCTQEVIQRVQSLQSNGYPPSTGFETARQAVAAAHSLPESPLTAQDVILASGCSGAIELCIGALMDAGHSILLPQPGFPLYQTIAENKGVICRYYRLLPDKQWEVDLDHLESLVDSSTRLLVLNNPSNPCGSVFSKQHLLDLLAFADRHHLPILADEIYAHMTFEPHVFYPLASLTTTVPILSVGGLAKRYLVPGWRLGWVLIHDRQGKFAQVRKGLNALSQLILGPNSLVQAALPVILKDTPDSFYKNTLDQLQKNAALSAQKLSLIPGLTIVMPQGAMYMMIGLACERFKDIQDDMQFVEKLVAEESVLCLPGQCFKQPSFVRIVFTAPAEQLELAFERIRVFCERHSK